jgi:hypothetical protein
VGAGGDREDELAWIARAMGANAATKGERVQSLWSGYGEIFRVSLTGCRAKSAIVKWAKPPARTRGARPDASHTRKCRSYDVEAAWYRTFAAQCDDTCRVATLIDARISSDQWLFLLEDLDAAGFHERHHDPALAELDACLAWLAAFHARFLGVAPNGLWKTGTYWHLETRPDELAAIDDAELREAAPILDRKLRSCTFQTIVHGDAKPANFCFAPSRGAVAAVDFQYVGGGCGMKDVAYLLNGAFGGSDAIEQRLLDAYFGHLHAAVRRRDDRASLDVDALEHEWRSVYAIACADYYRFIAGWAKEHWRRDSAAQRVTRRVLRAL